LMPPEVKSTPADWMSTVPVGAAEPVFPVTVMLKLMRADGEAVALLAVAVVVDGSNELGAAYTNRVPGDAVILLL
jgi:hypothetical protein